MDKDLLLQSHSLVVDLRHKSKRLRLVGLTGGIGSGKSYIAKHFEALGVEVYYADKEAKRLMSFDKELKARIKSIFGKESYHANGRLNRPFLGSRIFSDKTLLKKINAVVHPAVQKDFLSWAQNQKGPYVIEESAIIFENSLQSRFDKVILVVADTETRIARVMQRDKVDRKAVEGRMDKQLKDKKKIPLADYIVYNNEGNDIASQVKTIHQELIKGK